ncbi:AAA family ATPase [Actinopolyspora mortivallis]|uniref:AAA family ATPase n=1 Tax=Actinopolyspora mortivallis TaxID=33906 RepID=UPI000376E2B6|nr:AAA family ATPase [Actinopolyspora mortivallis]
MNDRPLDLPSPGLVMLIGPSGAGKSTLAARNFAPTQVVSSDHCRALVSDDPADQRATGDAFAVLHHLVDVRLRNKRLTVVDATNVREHDRQGLLRLAKQHDLPATAVVLDVPAEECVARNAGRQDKPDPAVTRQQHAELHRALGKVENERFRRVHVLRGAGEVDSATVRPHGLPVDRAHDHGPFDVIGDVHGCRREWEELLRRLGYRLHHDGSGRAVDADHPEGRRAVLLGDLVDRGPDSAGSLRLAMGMVESGNALAVPGNHEHKLVRALRGRGRPSGGLARTLEELSAWGEEFEHRVLEFCSGLPHHYVLAGGDLVVAHAGLPRHYHGRDSGRVRSFALYGAPTGERDEAGLPVRHPWARDYRGRAVVLYGHTPVSSLEWVNRTLCLDTGCVFGGWLSAVRYPECTTESVAAWQRYQRHPHSEELAPAE